MGVSPLLPLHDKQKVFRKEALSKDLSGFCSAYEFPER